MYPRMILLEKLVGAALDNNNPSIIHMTFCQSSIVPVDSDTLFARYAHATSMAGVE